MTPHDERLIRARVSLEGLSVGDALGERYFTGYAEELIAARTLPHPPWHFTDDTQMALSVYSVLRRHGRIDQDALASSFSAHYAEERGYGDAMNRLLPMIHLAGIWRMMTPKLFSGEGSFGNGAAMRVAPVGAYFADDLDAVVQQAALSAEVTHAHPEGIAGAIAVAVAAAIAWRQREQPPISSEEFLDKTQAFIPSGLVAEGVQQARLLLAETTVTAQDAARLLGSGYNVSAQDTVPFALWCAAQYLDNYEEAIWLTAEGMGDIDTTCAMVGGIVALSAGVASMPASWRQAREPLPRWPFQEQNEQ